MHTLMENGDLVHESQMKEYMKAQREDKMSVEEMPSEPVFTPLPIPPRPSTAIGGFTPRKERVMRRYRKVGVVDALATTVILLFLVALSIVVTAAPILLAVWFAKEIGLF